MVQASHARKIDYYGHPEVVRQQPMTKIKRVYTKKNPRQRTFIKAGILVFGYAVLWVYLCVAVSTLGYQSVSLENDVEAMYAANRMLEFEIAEKVSLDKVEVLATTQLGMCKLDADKVIEVKADQNSAIQVAAQDSGSDSSESGNTNVGERSLQKLYSNLMLLAEKR